MLYLKNNNIYNHLEFYILVIICFLSFIKTKFILSFLLLIIILFLLYFHRNTEHIPINTYDYILYSPAQGKILNITKGKIKTKISIFLSVFDNHTQCIPMQGTKVDEIFKYGYFYFAQNLEGSQYNQQLKHVFKTKFGNIDIIQYTGFFTRRIYSLSSNRDKIYKIGDKLGYIRFGSRVDIDVPNNIVSKILVKKDTKISMLQPLMELK
jgi:phosphatidylserine decarboxylase